jgi:hypothetical protein
MKPRDPVTRRRLTVPGRGVTAHVSPEDIERYLIHAGYRADRISNSKCGWPVGAPMSFEWGDGEEGRTIRLPREPVVTLEEVLQSIALHQSRSPGKILEDIVQLAGAPIQRHAISLEELSDIAAGIPGLDDLPGVRPWDAARLGREVKKLGDPHLSGAMVVLAGIDRRLQKWRRRPRWQIWWFLRAERREERRGRRR